MPRLTHVKVLQLLQSRPEFADLHTIASDLSPTHNRWTPLKLQQVKRVEENWGKINVTDAEYFACLSVINNRPVCVFFNRSHDGCHNPVHNLEENKEKLHYCIFCGKGGHSFGFQDFYQEFSRSKDNPCERFKKVNKQYWMFYAFLSRQYGKIHASDLAKCLIGDTSDLHYEVRDKK